MRVGGTPSRRRTGFAEGCVDHDPAPGQGAGREGFRQFFTELTTAFPDAQIAPEHVVVDDERWGSTDELGILNQLGASR